MAKIKVFLDTDVIISSLLSDTGASFEIINLPKIQKFISILVKAEVEEVARKLKISSRKVKSVLKNTKSIKLKLSKQSLADEYGKYVLDEKDVHVVAEVHKSKAKFLLTHNTRHYRDNKIKTDLGIITLKPGNFLQYLRSKGKF